jgi:hypothetical protein
MIRADLLEPACKSCSRRTLIDTNYCTRVCCSCGTEHPGHLVQGLSITSAYQIPLKSQCNYTRVKRFRKYLQRACMQQTSNSVPQATWEYLLDRAPFRGPKHIVSTLKRSGLRKKCYDSLPFLVNAL